MKKALAFILSIIYFTISTGFIVNVHYCMGKIDSVNIEQSSKKCCCKKKHKKCCNTQKQLVKVSDNVVDVHKTFIKTNFGEFHQPSVYSNQMMLINYKKVETNTFYFYPPPLKKNNFAQIFYGVFLI
ncbi:MAG: hypothetical protein KGZ59_08820 [Chitinophagaceae bacterium]|nr:hypothetical protein [Chitinophagaceae bacterium]